MVNDWGCLVFTFRFGLDWPFRQLYLGDNFPCLSWNSLGIHSHKWHNPSSQTRKGLQHNEYNEVRDANVDFSFGNNLNSFLTQVNNRHRVDWASILCELNQYFKQMHLDNIYLIISKTHLGPFLKINHNNRKNNPKNTTQRAQVFQRFCLRSTGIQSGMHWVITIVTSYKWNQEPTRVSSARKNKYFYFWHNSCTFV